MLWCLNLARFIVSFSIVPIGTCSTSLSQYVARAIEAMDKKGVNYTITPMSTIIEGDSLDEIFEAIKVAHKAIEEMGVGRILIRINIDDRIDKANRKPEDKVKSVLEKKKS